MEDHLSVVQNLGVSITAQFSPREAVREHTPKLLVSWLISLFITQPFNIFSKHRIML